MKTKQTILVVEDEKPLSHAISDKLTSEGYDVITAASVDSATEHIDNLESNGIVFVWLDHYLMGQKTGLDFVAHVRANDTTKHLPIFVVTNTGGREKKQTYLHLGADKYFIKSDNQLGEIISDVKEKLASL